MFFETSRLLLVSREFEKVSASVSSGTEKLTSWSCLGLGPQRLVFRARESMC